MFGHGEPVADTPDRIQRFRRAGPCPHPVAGNRVELRQLQFGRCYGPVDLRTACKGRCLLKMSDGGLRSVRLCFQDAEAREQIGLVVDPIGPLGAFEDLVERCLGFGFPVQTNECRRAPGVSQHWKQNLKVFGRDLQRPI